MTYPSHTVILREKNSTEESKIIRFCFWARPKKVDVLGCFTFVQHDEKRLRVTQGIRGDERERRKNLLTQGAGVVVVPTEDAVHRA